MKRVRVVVMVLLLALLAISAFADKDKKEKKERKRDKVQQRESPRKNNRDREDQNRPRKFRRDPVTADIFRSDKDDRSKRKIRGVWPRSDEDNPWGEGRKTIKTRTNEPVFQNQDTQWPTKQRRHEKKISQQESWPSKVETKRRDRWQTKDGDVIRSSDGNGKVMKHGKQRQPVERGDYETTAKQKFQGFKEPSNFDRHRSKDNLHSTVQSRNSQEKWHFDRKRAPKNITYIDRSRNTVVVNNYTKNVNRYGRPRNHFMVWDNRRSYWGYSNCYYDGYWPYYGQHGRYYSPFWHYGGPRYILESRVYIEPIVVFYSRETLPYEWRPYSGASDAVRDIRNAWLESDMELMSGYIADKNVRVFFNHKYQYTLNPNDFYAMTLDAMSNSDTSVMDFNRPDWWGISEFTVKGRQKFKNQFGDWQTKYLTYRLHRYSGNWYIISLNISDKR